MLPMNSQTMSPYDHMYHHPKVRAAAQYEATHPGTVAVTAAAVQHEKLSKLKEKACVDVENAIQRIAEQLLAAVLHRGCR